MNTASKPGWRVGRTSSADPSMSRTRPCSRAMSNASRATLPHAAVPAERADLQHAFRLNYQQQQMEQLAFFGRDVDRRQVFGRMTRADFGENRIFSGEQLGDVALESLVHYAVASTFGKGGTSSSQRPARRDCLSISTSM